VHQGVGKVARSKWGHRNRWWHRNRWSEVAAPSGSDHEFLGGSSMSLRGSKGGRRRSTGAIYSRPILENGLGYRANCKIGRRRWLPCGEGSPEEGGGPWHVGLGGQREKGRLRTPSGNDPGGLWAEFGAGPDWSPAAFLIFSIFFLFSIFWFLIYLIYFAKMLQNHSNLFQNFF
jgi:hypothetical protein